VRGGFPRTGVVFGVVFGAFTRMVGSCVPVPAGGCSELGLVPCCPSPAGEGEGDGAVVVGAASAGGGGDCGNCEGAVCAKAPAQSDEIKKEVDASNRGRGRNDTESPLSEAKTNDNHLCA
jgi:hypothetical protein